MKPTLSIIIPCYNGEKYLADAVNSILKQPCQDLEIIIVDDGSKDSSGAIADEFAAEHVNIHAYHIPNGGVSVARNTGLDHAVGQYICFLDADDVLCRNAYDKDIHNELTSGQYDILSFSHMKGMADLDYGCMISANAQELYLREQSDYIKQTYKHFCSFIYGRHLFTDEIRFPEGIRYHEDVCFLFLIARNSKNIMQHKKPWFVYRMNYSSAMHTLKNADHILEEIEAWEWCRKNSPREKDISDCEGNIFSYMVDYIRFSCMYNTPIETIYEKIQSCEPFQKAIVHYGTFWLNKKTAQLYAEFMKTPQKVWLYYRLKGIPYTTAQWFIRTKFGNIVNQKLRYKLVLKDYLVE
ncbi:MAG: glycosyltransferase [Oscillospiraceae bacterium]|nr:glycosyltransferase [Oscillospiraceae bacterium]